MISIGAAGHVIPMFELAKAMKHHNVTFITESVAQNYIDFGSYRNSLSLRVIFTNESIDALADETKIENDLVEYFTNHSLVDSLAILIPTLARSIDAILNKTIQTLMIEQYDVIIAESFIKGVHALSNDTNIPCVIQIAGVKLDQFYINLPDRNSFLSSKQMSQLKYRIYNVAYHLRLMGSIGIKLLPLVSTIFRSPPKIPGPFYNTLTLKNNFFTTTKCLHLHSIPPTLFPLSESSPYSIYLGPFIDESSIHHATNDLVGWVQCKPKHSIIYVAFGSSAQIRSNQMKSLIDGVMEFLLHTPTA
ncbi:unnamed protein product [Rotaria socialis]